MAGELLLSALRHVWTTLASFKIDAALMGGLAVAAWKHVRSTRDVDLLVGIKRVVDGDVVRCLADCGIKSLREPPILVVDQWRILQLSYEPPDAFIDIRIDLFFADSEYAQVALARRIPTFLPAVAEPVSVVTCEDLILFKLLAGRLIDRADAAYLLRLNHDSLDQAYLRDWVQRLGLTQEIADVWQEAFPDGPSPG